MALLDRAAASMRQIADVVPEAQVLAERLDSCRFEVADVAEQVMVLLSTPRGTLPSGSTASNPVSTRWQSSSANTVPMNGKSSPSAPGRGRVGDA